MNLIVNSAAGEHSFPVGEQKCLCSPVDIPKGVAKIVLKFLDREDASNLLKVSKGWAAVLLEVRANNKLLSRVIKGLESLFERHLRNVFIREPECVLEYTKYFAELRSKTIQKNCALFKLDELAQLHELLEDYLQVRTIEYTFCEQVIRDGAKLSHAPKRAVVWDEATCNMAGPFLKALVAEFKLKKAEDAILFKYTPLIANALKRDGSMMWLEKLKKINEFVTTETGKKLSAMETSWHLDFRKLRLKK